MPAMKTDDYFKRRIHTAQLQRHNGTQDTLGQPTYETDSDWVTFSEWPCEIVTASGGERIRGRQVSANTSHVLIGDPYAAKGVDPNCRAIIDGRTYNIAAVVDPDGLNHELRIEARQSW
jgi:hypothetical protein